jgi:hypothetical protein
MAGVAEKGVKNLASAGKILLDFAADETALAVDGVKEALRLPAPAGAMAEVPLDLLAPAAESLCSRL